MGYYTEAKGPRPVFRSEKRRKGEPVGLVRKDKYVQRKITRSNSKEVH